MVSGPPSPCAVSKAAQMPDFRVIVTGSRTWPDEAAVWLALNRVAWRDVPMSGTLTVIQGACPTGADAAAAAWYGQVRRSGNDPVIGRDLRLREEPHPADWKRHGRRGGPIRNQEMVDLGADLVLAFVMPCTLKGCAGKPEHVTHGTQDCIPRAEKAGIPVWRITERG